MRLSRLLFVSLAFAVSACDDPTGVQGRHLGYVDFSPTGPEVSVTREDGVVAIDMTTFGLNSCYERSGEEVDVEDGTITVRPFDRVEEDDDGDTFVCGDVVVQIAHHVTVEVGDADPLEVRIIGAVFTGDDEVGQDTLTLAVPAP